MTKQNYPTIYIVGLYSSKGGFKYMEELSYSLHLSNDKNKSKKARRSIKNTETGTTSLSNNAIQNHQQLSKVDRKSVV